ncbi:MAG: isopenicillin N synthase family dioxygenase [Pikeienuella sp.]
MLDVINVSPLFGEDTEDRRRTDALIMKAAKGVGFLQITGLLQNELIEAESRDRLKSIFNISDDVKRRLMRVNFNPENSAVYRGWYPAQPGVRSYKEGIDMGPDLAHEGRVAEDDPLREATPLPTEDEAPGWRAHATEWYKGLEEVGCAIMSSIARGLGLSEDRFAPLFEGGISSFRLAHYLPRTPETFGDEDPADATIDFEGEKLLLTGVTHIDSGFVTLLVQDGVSGLQVKTPDGWINAPPVEGAMVVNFGKLLQQWSGGVIRATPHRVVSNGDERYSIPFFYEPAVDAIIEPLDLPGATDFEPFYYGDFLWRATTKFVEQKGIAHLRKPRGPLPEDF